MKKKIFLIIIILIIIGVLVPIIFRQRFVVSPKKEEPKIEDSRGDLVSFSISPNEEVHGIVPYEGVIKGGYFFEANILINILDADKKLLKSDHSTATTDWMTSGPVSFAGNLDFTGLSKGPAYIQIHNDNASGLPEHDKYILIPIVIK
ncbi:MAG: hypothetical protein KGI58_01055 [Patescibacteria group bacterium]|nr:hypothetical protein [Patescibacteria group bacterium]